MNTKKQQGNVIEIDVQRLLLALWKRKILIAVVSVLGAIIALIGVVLFTTPKYQADVLGHINNRSISVGSTALSISSGELTVARQLLDTYLVALKSRTALDAVIERADLPYSREQLANMISAGAVNNTEWISIKVIAGDPEEAKIIADTVAEILPETVSRTIEGSSIKILDYAVKPQGKIDPGYKKYTAIGFIVGLVLICGILALEEIFDDKVHGEDTLSELSDTIPVLANIPKGGEKGSHSKYSSKYGRYGYKYGSRYGYGYGYGKKKQSSDASPAAKETKKTKADAAKKPQEDQLPICNALDFAATEAYNLLQASVQYSFSDNGSCKVIGITSSERNEGKSTVSINLAYSLSSDKKKVLLLEGDMRLPSIGKKLGINGALGLSEYLTGKIQNNEGILQTEKAPGLAIMCSGAVPPNPFRLLDSVSMEKLIETLRQKFDYIIVDLPPVNIVSDPLSVAKYLDGFIVVARNEYSSRQGIKDVVKKLQIVNANIIGFALHGDVSPTGRKYSRYSKYNRYTKYGKYGHYSKYGNSSYSSYEKSASYAADYADSYERAAKETDDRFATVGSEENGKES